MDKAKAKGLPFVPHHSLTSRKWSLITETLACIAQFDIVFESNIILMLLVFNQASHFIACIKFCWLSRCYD